jgi:hypothetical protein
VKRSAIELCITVDFVKAKKRPPDRFTSSIPLALLSYLSHLNNNNDEEEFMNGKICSRGSVNFLMLANSMMFHDDFLLFILPHEEASNTRVGNTQKKQSAQENFLEKCSFTGRFLLIRITMTLQSLCLKQSTDLIGFAFSPPPISAQKKIASIEFQ